MAAAKYYRKTVPNVPIVHGGISLKFQTLDGISGYFSTDNPSIQGHFSNLISAGLFQMSEVSWEEFDSNFLKKKASVSTPLKPVWREELSNQRKATPVPLSVSHAAAVNEVKQVKQVNIAMEGEEFPRQQAAPSLAVEERPTGFQPTVGKRII